MRPTRLLIMLAMTLLSSGEGHLVDASADAAPAVLDTAGDPGTTSQGIRLRDEIRDPDQASGIVDVFLWAVDRYDELGLELPSMTVTFHRQRSRCSGFQGLWTSSVDGMRIDICVGGHRKRARILLHELAHAWLADHLDEPSRDAFVVRQGIPGWSGAEMEREYQGMELAAWILVWGIDEHCERSEWLLGMDDAELADEFESLTHETPLCTVAGERKPW